MSTHNMFYGELSKKNLMIFIKYHQKFFCFSDQDMILPLLDLMNSGKRKEEQRMLGKKATEVFDSLYKVKKVNRFYHKTH